MNITAGELARMVNGTLEGDPGILITHPSKIEEGIEGSVSFLANLKYESYLYTTSASMIIVAQDFIPKSPIKPALLRVDNVYMAVGNLLNKFERVRQKLYGIHDSAIVDASVTIGESIYIGPQCVIGANAILEDNVVLDAQVYIGESVKIGHSTRIHPGVKIYEGCRIGSNCVIHSNAVIGSDGFGFSPDTNGQFKKVAQLGNVVIGDSVEIGSNTTIDRATMGSTLVGNGCKLDNLIQIAHNVQIGDNTVIAAQTGIAGSSKIGKNCMIGGQVGIAGHLNIADGTMIQAQSGIGGSLTKENGKWYGSPAIDYYTYLRAYSEFRKLPDIVKKLKELEEAIRGKKA